MSSMRPPMLAGPMPRHTKPFNIGSVDQLIGVGVGVAVGVMTATLLATGLGDADGVCVGTGLSARVASAPRVTITRKKAARVITSAARSRVERHMSFIRRVPFLKLLKEGAPETAKDSAAESNGIKNFKTDLRAPRLHR